MNRKKKVLLSALVFGALGALAGATLADFTAQTKNPNNAFAAGTLVLSNTKQGGSTCLSTAGGATDSNVNDNCDQLINLSVKSPGDSGTANLTLKNEGDISGATFKVFMAACTASSPVSESYHGSADPCGSIQIYVQQWSSSNFTSPSACVYGGAQVANTCDFSDATKTLSNFNTSYNSSSSGLSLSGLNAGASKYYTIGVKLPQSGGNNLQGRQATFDLTWFLSQ